MPVVLKIDPRRKVVYSSFYGKITDEELLGHGAKIGADPDFNAAFNEIVDFTGVSSPSVTMRTLQAIATAPSLYSEDSMHIIVAPDELALQFANTFKTIAQGKRRNIFVVRDRTDAYRLLDGK
jgi:hypothetical protein